MPRSIWTGAISFGLVTVPVKLYSAVNRKTVRFNQLNGQTGSRIAQKRVDASTGEEVNYEDLVKGYEIATDRYVVIEPSELESVQPEKTKTIDIEDFVDLEEIDPIFYDHPYYLAPGTGGAKPYRLLLEAMRATNKVAIAKVVIRQKESLVAIRALADHDVLEMATMLFADEVVDPERLDDIPDADDVKTSARELDIAKQLVESLAGAFEPEKYKDTYREAVLAMIEKKAAGEEIVVQEVEEEAVPVPDLMSALKASLDAVRKTGGGGSGDEDGGDATAAEKPKRKRATTSGAASTKAKSGAKKFFAGRGWAGRSPGTMPQPRLRKVDCSGPGLRRVRRGRGFAITDADGERVEDAEVLTRVDELVVPPAWRDVWICPYPGGHIQATGIDQAGRKQYLYHPRWRARRDAIKFEDMVIFARTLPELRERVEQDLAREDFSFDHVMAIAVRLLDRGFFRIGTEDYAVTNETYGLATMKKRHVRVRGDDLLFDYPAKHSKRRVQAVIDGDVAQDVCRLKQRRAGGDELLAYKNPSTRKWVDVKSSDINAWLKDATGEDVSAKDFRTWGATVLAAVGLAVSPVPDTKTARKRAMTRVVKEVARHLGNTPAVARASYIDPRVFDRYIDGTTIAGTLPGLAEEGDGTAIQGEVEGAVLQLLTGEDSPAMAPPGGADLLIAA